MSDSERTALGRRVVLGGLTGFFLALVVSSGILAQRVLGLTAAHAVAANVATTLAAVIAVVMTVRIFLSSLSSLEPAGLAGTQDVRIMSLVAGQAAGAVIGVLVLHHFASRDLASHPWLDEHPRQLVNDLVAVFGILAFVWASAQKPVRIGVMVAGLMLVLGYEITAAYWHLDAPAPVADVLPWTVQRFVGSEVTASGLGVLTFRLLLA